jgi:hypothetical protein
MEYVPFCDQSLQRHEQIVTDKHFSSSDNYQGALRLFPFLDGGKSAESSFW